MPVDYLTDPRYAHLSLEQIRTHYLVEKELRETILSSDPEERTKVFMWAYDELFRRIPWHPALTEKSGINNPELIRRRAKVFGALIGEPPKGVLEIGCGHGELVIGLSKIGFNCVGLDISAIRINQLQEIENRRLHFKLSEGSNLPFEDNSFDVVISMQLLEHLHPDDVLEHLIEVKRVLKPRGKYLLETPNKWVGPGDVSRFFSEIPQGFHLKEYSIADLCSLLHRAKYSKVKVVLRKKSFYRNFFPFVWKKYGRFYLNP